MAHFLHQHTMRDFPVDRLVQVPDPLDIAGANGHLGDGDCWDWDLVGYNLSGLGLGLGLGLYPIVKYIHSIII